MQKPRVLRQCSPRHFRDEALTKLATLRKEDSHEPDSTRCVHWAIHNPGLQQYFNALVAETRTLTSNLGSLHLKTFEIHLVNWRRNLGHAQILPNHLTRDNQTSMQNYSMRRQVIAQAIPALRLANHAIFDGSCSNRWCNTFNNGPVKH